METHRYVGFAFNAVGRPLYSVGINILRIVVLLVPLSYLGARLLGLPGLFWGRVVTDISAACLALLWSRSFFKTLEAAPRA